MASAKFSRKFTRRLQGDFSGGACFCTSVLCSVRCLSGREEATRSEMDLRWGQGTLQLCSARVCPRVSHSETATSILLAFVGGGSHHLIWNRPDVNHYGDPIDGEEKKSEAGREGGGQ